MEQRPDNAAPPPGVKWALILGGAGFVAGFFGPLVFVPDANQGPLVGILISGPLGLLLGLLMWLVCALVKPPAFIQWRLLYAIATIGVVTTLLLVQPGPQRLGAVYDAEVLSCATPREREASVLEHWDRQVAAYTYATPRAGWRADMQRMLRTAPGAVVTMRLLRTNSIEQHRKPWNRRQAAAGWQQETREVDFHDETGSCAQYPEGSLIRGFQQSGHEARLATANVWPPTMLLHVLTASAMQPVPPQWAGL